MLLLGRRSELICRAPHDVAANARAQRTLERCEERAEHGARVMRAYHLRRRVHAVDPFAVAAFLPPSL